MLDIDLFSLPFFIFSWLCNFTNAFIGFLYLDINKYAYMCFMEKLEYIYIYTKTYKHIPQMKSIYTYVGHRLVLSALFIF